MAKQIKKSVKHLLKIFTEDSIVLEKRENFEIQQNSKGVSQKKTTFIRKRFYRQQKNRCESGGQEKEVLKQTFSKANTDINKGLVLEKERQAKFEQKLEVTSFQLANLEDNINDEIEKLQKESNRLLKKSQNMERKKHQTKGQEETWAAHLAGNSSMERKPYLLKKARERYSTPRKCSCTAPINNEKNSPAGLGVETTAKIECVDRGAVGDHIFASKLRLRKPNKMAGSKDILKEYPSFNKKNDCIVNCCCSVVLTQPQCHNSIHSKAAKSVCYHLNRQQSCVDNRREGHNCCKEHYYDCGSNLPCTCCSKAAAGTSHNRRRTTDLNTDCFYCRPRDRSFSRECHFDAKSKKNTKETSSKSKQPHEEYNERKKREHEKPKGQPAQVKNYKIKKVTTIKGEKENSKLLKNLDRYVDDHEKLFNSKECRTAQTLDDVSTPTTVKMSSEIESCQVTLRKQHKACDPREEAIANVDHISLETQTSLKTLYMLKKMKIREYKPAKPKEKYREDNPYADTSSGKKQKEKLKNYQQYLENYRKENQVEKLLQIFKIHREQESELLDIFKQQAQDSRKMPQHLTKDALTKDMQGIAEADFKDTSDKDDNSSQNKKSSRKDGTNLQETNILQVPQNHEQRDLESWPDKRYNQEKFDKKDQTFGEDARDIKDEPEHLKCPVKDDKELEKSIIRRPKELKVKEQEFRYNNRQPSRGSSYNEDKFRDSWDLKGLKDFNYEEHEPGYPRASGYEDNIRNTLDQETQSIKHLREKSSSEAPHQYEEKSLQLKPYKFNHENEENSHMKILSNYQTEVYNDAVEQLEHLKDDLKRDSKEYNDQEKAIEKCQNISDAKPVEEKDFKVESEQRKRSVGDHNGVEEISIRGSKANEHLRTRASYDNKIRNVSDQKIQPAKRFKGKSLNEPPDQYKDIDAQKLAVKGIANKSKNLEIQGDSIDKMQYEIEGQAAKYTGAVDDKYDSESHRAYQGEETPLSQQSKNEKTQSARPSSFVKENQADCDTKQKELTTARRSLEAAAYNQEYLLKTVNGRKFNEEMPQGYVKQEFDELEEKSHTSSYSDFKQVMDHNFGFYTHRSSQTDNDFTPNLKAQYSQQAFSTEKDRDQNSQISMTTDDILKYLNDFLKSYQHSDLKETCLDSVASAVNDLIEKISSCKCLMPQQGPISGEVFKQTPNYAEEEKITQDIQFKDLESTPDSSDSQLRQKTKQLYNLPSLLAQINEHDLELKKEQESFSFNENNKPAIKIPVEMKDLEPQDFDRELVAANNFFEKESYQFQSQAISDDCQTSETYHRYQDYKANSNSLTLPAQFSEEQSLHYNVNKEEKYNLAYIRGPSASRQPIFDPALIPSKGILKPCRLAENSEEVSCDLETYRTTSVISTKEGSSITCNPGLKTLVEECDEDIITKSKHLRPIMKQSNLKLNEANPIKQPIYQDCQFEAGSVLENYPRNSSRTFDDVEMPAFKNCPCMWDTYVKMMINYYKGRNK